MVTTLVLVVYTKYSSFSLRTILRTARTLQTALDVDASLFTSLCGMSTDLCAMMSPDIRRYNAGDAEGGPGHVIEGYGCHHRPHHTRAGVRDASETGGTEVKSKGRL